MKEVGQGVSYQAISEDQQAFPSDNQSVLLVFSELRPSEAMLLMPMVPGGLPGPPTVLMVL